MFYFRILSILSSEPVQPNTMPESKYYFLKIFKHQFNKKNNRKKKDLMLNKSYISILYQIWFFMSLCVSFCVLFWASDFDWKKDLLFNKDKHIFFCYKPWENQQSINGINTPGVLMSVCISLVCSILLIVLNLLTEIWTDKNYTHTMTLYIFYVTDKYTPNFSRFIRL